MFGIATFFFLGRVISRITTFGGAGFYWDDYACVSCYIPLVGIAIVLQLAVNNGLGQDDYRIGVANVNQFLKVKSIKGLLSIAMLTALHHLRSFTPLNYYTTM